MTSSRCTLSVGFMSVLFIFLVIIAIASGDTSVYLRSDNPHQHVTSSTLNWHSPIHGTEWDKIVIGGFQRIRDPDDPTVIKNDRRMYVCRASHKTVWVAGTLLEGEKRCTVTSLGSVASYERYELLENVQNAARLSWMPWDKYHQIPTGAVETDSMYVARYLTRDENNETVQYIGTLDNTSDLGTISYVKDDGKEYLTSEGEILVETEPIYYELKSVRINPRKKIHKNTEILIGRLTFSNSQNEPSELGQVLTHPYKYYSYWGQGHAMIKALNTSITLVNGTKLYNIAWGMEDAANRTIVYPVKFHLQPGTTVNVTLRGNYTDYEAPYTGQLVSHYTDGEVRTREINGQRHEVTMMDVTPDFGPVYFLSNHSIVPTTLSPPTTHEATGTTNGSTSKSTTLNSGSTNDITSSATTAPDIMNSDEDENRIIQTKPDRSNIQNNDGGPQSLKNKEQQDNSSNTFQLSITILLSSLLINLHRIT